MAALKPAIQLTYCTQCNWLLRSAWMAQELFSTFGDDMSSATLAPGTGGIFQITLNGALIWDHRRDGGFLDLRRLKSMMRDPVCPTRDLGHVYQVAQKPFG